MDSLKNGNGELVQNHRVKYFYSFSLEVIVVYNIRSHYASELQNILKRWWRKTTDFMDERTPPLPYERHTYF